jgi:hypothetical protein
MSATIRSCAAPTYLVKLGFKLFGRRNSAPTPFHLSVSENDQGRHTLDIIRGGYRTILINIHLYNGHRVACHGFQLFQDGRHHLAWAAPFRREIDQHGLVPMDKVTEFLVAHFFRFCMNTRSTAWQPSRDHSTKLRARTQALPANFRLIFRAEYRNGVREILPEILIFEKIAIDSLCRFTWISIISRV